MKLQQKKRGKDAKDAGRQ